MTLPHQPTLNDFFFLFLIINEFLLKQIDIASFSKGSSIGCELCLIKRRSLVRIPLSLILCEHVKKKKKKKKKTKLLLLSLAQSKAQLESLSLAKHSCILCPNH
jgi:hypothetical protein